MLLEDTLYIHQIAVDWSQAEIAYKLMQRSKGMLIPNKNTNSLPPDACQNLASVYLHEKMIWFLSGL